jgi:hypothetical protein
VHISNITKTSFMKKTIIQLFLSLILASQSFAQVATPNFANYYYRITVQDGSGYVLAQNISSPFPFTNGRIFSRASTGSTLQQWAVMPTFITAKNGALVTSQEFVMGSRVNGKMVDIKDGSAVQSYLPFHGSSNQMFTLFPYGGNVYAIRSQADPNKVFDRSDNNNTINFYAPWHQGGNQRFLFTPTNNFSSSFSSLRTKNLQAIPFPAAPTSFTQQMPIETPKTFIQETLFPYHFITNDLPPAQQIEYSPYYKVVHYQYYRAASGNWDAFYYPGIQIQHTIKVKNGITQSKVTEVTSKTNVSFSATGEVTGTIAKLSGTLTAAWSTAKERSVKTVTSFSETNEVEETHTRTINVSNNKRIVTYQLVDYYETYRANSATPILTWEVGRNQYAELSYEETSGGRITTNASKVMRFELKDGKMIPLSEKAPEEVKLGEKNISVYPNPSKGIYKLEGSAAIQPSVSIQVYDQSGKMVYQEQKANTPINGIVINISHLRPGHYVLKLVAGKNVTTNKIIKE